MARVRVYDTPEDTRGTLRIWLSRQSLVRLAEFTEGYRLQAAATVVAMILLTASGLAGPYLLKVAIDEGIAAGDMGMLTLAAVLYLGASVLGALFNGLQTYGIQWVGERIIRDLRDRLFRHLSTLDIGFFTHQRAGWVISRLTNDIEALQQLLTEGASSLVTNTLTLFGAIIILLMLDFHLALITLSVLPVLLIGTAYFRVHAVKAYRRVRNRVADLTASLQETVGGIRVVQAFAQEESNFRIFKAVNERYRKANMDTVVISGLYFPGVEFLNATATAVIFLYGGHRVADGELTIGVLVAFIGYLTSFFSPVESLSELYNSFQSAGAAMEKIFRVLDTEPDPTETYGTERLLETRGDIEFRGVSFGYPGESEEVLHGIDLHIAPGQKVALVGSTGAGKTTMARLLLRFFQPDQGQILIDGVDLHDYHVRDYRKALGYVPQEPYLFTGTVLDNIRMTEPNADAERVYEAARQLGVDDVFSSLPQGYQTTITQGGVGLSAGERQLVAFARAFFSQPPILILDEATSSVDPATEGRMERALDSLLAGRTAIIIAHRLSTVENADRILVLEQGQIIEDGVHVDLIRAGGPYARLYHAQLREHSPLRGPEGI